MAKKSLKEEVGAWMDRNGIDYIDISKGGNTVARYDVGKNKKMKSDNDNTDQMAWGDYTFKITAGNMLNLSTLCKYAQMLDFVTKAESEEQLNIDGVINEVLDEALSKRVKELAKKHGFMDADDFIKDLDGCEDGEEVAAAIKRSEQAAYVRAHERILAHIPLEDRQMSLFDK